MMKKDEKDMDSEQRVKDRVKRMRAVASEIEEEKDMSDQEIQREAYHIQQMAKAANLIAETTTMLEELESKLEGFLVPGEPAVVEESKGSVEPTLLHSALVDDLTAMNKQLVEKVVEPLRSILDRVDV